MDALIFDFDGVVVNSEPIHCKCFQATLWTVGVNLTEEDYYAKYLGYDDHDCFLVAARDSGLPLTEPQIAALTAAKTRLVLAEYRSSVQVLPGVAELIRTAAAAGVPVGVCSGALREEIELAARALGLLDCFRTIVAARDVRHGKPDPEGYALAMRRLSAAAVRPLDPARCLAIEDSPAGIDAAHGAGMRVLAVTNSYPAGQLVAAERVVASLADVTLADVRTLCDP
jgi:beta-phosphoglucomutase